MLTIRRFKKWYLTLPPTTTLTPVPGVNVPGLIEHTALVYRTDPRFAFSTLVINWPDLTVMEAHRLMQGEYEVDGDSVVITFV
jgi:hypothetical protein